MASQTHPHSFPFEEIFLIHQHYIGAMLTASSLILVILGWLYNSHKARVLQRRQLSIQLLDNNRYQPEWVNAKKALFSKFTNQAYGPQFWTDLAIKKYDPSHTKTPAEEKDINDLQTVINTFEFISIAILNRAVDEDIIRWSYEYFFVNSHRILDGYIDHARTSQNDDSIFCNFSRVVSRWQSDPMFGNNSVAGPKKGKIKKFYEKMVIKLYQKTIGQ